MRRVWGSNFLGCPAFAKSVEQTSDGGYIVAGTYATVTAGAPVYDALLMKLDPSGTIVWQKYYDGGNQCNVNGCYSGSDARAVRATVDGGYVFAGYVQFQLVNPPVPETASWLVKTDASGTIVWQNDFYQLNTATGLPYPSAFSGMELTSDGGFVAAGYTDKYNNSDNIWVVKTDANGDIPGCQEVHPSLVRALKAGLSASALSLPVKAVSAAGARVTSGTLAGSLTAHKDC